METGSTGPAAACQSAFTARTAHRAMNGEPVASSVAPMTNSVPSIRPPRQRHAAPDQDLPGRQRRAYAGKSPPSTAKYHVRSSSSARSAQGSATQQTLLSPSYAAQSSAGSSSENGSLRSSSTASSSTGSPASSRSGRGPGRAPQHSNAPGQDAPNHRFLGERCRSRTFPRATASIGDL